MPAATPLDPEAIPQELKALPQWVTWKEVLRDGRMTKPPFRLDGTLGDSSDPEAWSSFQEALEVYQKGSHGFEGIGFTFSVYDPYSGVDLDHCRSPETGEIALWAWEIIQVLDSYTEISPSGEGVHIIVKGRLPGERNRTGDIEMYDKERYFTCTGHLVEGTRPTIERRQEQLTAFYNDTFPKEAKPAPAPSQSVDLDDEALLEKARAAKNGDKFSRLWNGDTSGYGSQSEADLALCSSLAFWTSGDRARMDSLFRQSGLYRAKWEREDYCTLTLDKALEGGASYNTNGHHENTHGDEVAEVKPPEPTHFALTDTGNAELLAHLFGNKLRFDHRRGMWLVWAGHWWRDDADGQVKRQTIEAARARFQSTQEITDLKAREVAAKWAIRSENRDKVEATLSLAQALPPIADAGDRWDAFPLLLGVGNGVVDLWTGTLRPGRPGELMMLHTDVAYDPDALCPRWTTFLNEIFGSDRELIDYFHRVAGYTATGSVKEQEAFLLYGTGWNGKSTILTILGQVLGDYSANTPFSTWQASRDSQGVPSDLAVLPGRRLVTAAETSENARLNEARIKAVVGGDPITARHLYGRWFTFTPSFKLWLCVNHRPRVNDDSLGFWRKIRLLPFERSFEAHADRELLDKLWAEASGILTWIVQGALAWQRQGLRPVPDRVLAATQEWRAEADPLEGFLQDACVASPTAMVRAGDLYKAYTEWAQKEGLRKEEILTNTMFGRRVVQRFTRDSDEVGRFYRGLGLKA